MSAMSPVKKLDEVVEDEREVSSQCPQDESNCSGKYSVIMLPKCGSSQGGKNHPCVMATRIENLEQNDTVILNELTSIRETLGESPDITTNKAGSGMARTLYRVANAVIRNEMPSFHDIDPTDVKETSQNDFESEITTIQSRADLVARARSAEAALKAHKEAIASNAIVAVESNKNALEVGKLSVEKWKVIVAVIGILFGPGVMNFLIQHIPNFLNSFVK